MRILYVIMAYGPHIIASEVHSELGTYYRAEGHSFSVLSPADHTGSGQAGAKAFPAEADQVAIFNLSFKKSGWRRLLRRASSLVFKYAFFLELWWEYQKFLSEHRNDFELLHVESAYPLGAVCALAAWRAKIPFIINLQGADVMRVAAYDYGYGRYWLARQLLRFTFKRASAIRANSEQTARIALSYGADPARVTTILRNISSMSYPPDGQTLPDYKQNCRAALCTRYGLDPAYPILITYSRLHPFKGIDWLIRALPLLQAKHGRVSLLVCGPSRTTPRFGDYRQYLEKLARQLGVESSVIFTGKIEFAHSREYLAGADLLVVPSVEEALNKVVIEAAAAGTPSVVTRTTGIAGPAVQAGVAVSVAPADAEALAEGISEVLGAGRQLGKAGPDFARDFSSASIGEKLLDLYRQTIQQGRARTERQLSCEAESRSK